MRRRRWLARALGLALPGPLWACPQQAAAALPGDPHAEPESEPFGCCTRLRFASLSEGRRLIAAQDEWTAVHSPLLRSAAMVLPRTEPVSAERFSRYLQDTVLPWDDSARHFWQVLFGETAAAFERLCIALPPEVLLVRTDGRDWGGAPYTRGQAVFLPAGLQHEGYSRLEVLAHELVHLSTRFDPVWASRLYGLFGFRGVAPLEWPAEWLPWRLANPDAPHSSHAIRLTLADGRRVDAMPVLVARHPERRPDESVLDLVEVRLLEVRILPGEPTRPVRGPDGLPRWHAPTAVPDYLRQLGGNTRYVDHPEEVLADNLAFMVSGRPVANPLLLAMLEASMSPR